MWKEGGGRVGRRKRKEREDGALREPKGAKEKAFSLSLLSLFLFHSLSLLSSSIYLRVVPQPSLEGAARVVVLHAVSVEGL